MSFSAVARTAALVASACTVLFACGGSSEPARPAPVRSAPPSAVAALPVPAILGLVSDHAHVLSPDERLALELLLHDYEARTEHELSVLTVTTTGAETIEAYANRVARAWGIGKPGRNNGLLIVVATTDRIARIEVAGGLIALGVTNEFAQEVLDLTLVPAFTRERYAEGLEAGLVALMHRIDAGR